MLIPIITLGVVLMILERLWPDRPLPSSAHWWKRVLVINLFQLGIVVLGMHTWDLWFASVGPRAFGDWPAPLAGLVAYLSITFVFYWWHRWRHTIRPLWLVLHQVHHSPQRIETITSFYKHPLEILTNACIMGSLHFMLLGVEVEAAAWSLIYASIGEYLYHMNISTPHWWGYFFQRPEMHRIHHMRGHHRQNFSDLPLWDMLFGTYHNPRRSEAHCGFADDGEVKLASLLALRTSRGLDDREGGIAVFARAGGLDGMFWPRLGRRVLGLSGSFDRGFSPALGFHGKKGGRDLCPRFQFGVGRRKGHHPASCCSTGSLR